MMINRQSFLQWGFGPRGRTGSIFLKNVETSKIQNPEIVGKLSETGLERYPGLSRSRDGSKLSSESNGKPPGPQNQQENQKQTLKMIGGVGFKADG